MDVGSSSWKEGSVGRSEGHNGRTSSGGVYVGKGSWGVPGLDGREKWLATVYELDCGGGRVEDGASVQLQVNNDDDGSISKTSLLASAER